jgi:hypothetical protein
MLLTCAWAVPLLQRDALPAAGGHVVEIIIISNPGILFFFEN